MLREISVAETPERVVRLVVPHAELRGEAGEEDPPSQLLPVRPDVGQPHVPAGHAPGVDEGERGEGAVAHPSAGRSRVDVEFGGDRAASQIAGRVCLRTRPATTSQKIKVMFSESFYIGACL